MYTLENSNPLVECNVRRLTRSCVTSMPSDVDKATRSSSWSMLSSSVPPRSMRERGSGGGGGGGGGGGCEAMRPLGGRLLQGDSVLGGRRARAAMWVVAI